MATQQVVIPVRGTDLAGELQLPEEALGLVLFAHGSGSSRHSPRNQFVAGTLLFDLMTEEEEQAEVQTRHLRFDIRFLAERLAGATRWVLDKATTRDLNVGYFGAS